MIEEYTVNDLIDESVAQAPDLSYYVLSDFDDKGYSDLKDAITDESIAVGTQQLEKIQREGEAIIADINSQILEKINEQEQEKSEIDDFDSDSDSDSDDTDSANF